MSKMRVPLLPKDWYLYHSPRCGIASRGCVRECPKRIYEQTGSVRLFAKSRELVEQFGRLLRLCTDSGPYRKEFIMPKPKSSEKKVREFAAKLALAGFGGQMYERFEAEELAQYCLDVAQAVYDIELEDEEPDDDEGDDGDEDDDGDDGDDD